MTTKNNANFGFLSWNGYKRYYTPQFELGLRLYNLDGGTTMSSTSTWTVFQFTSLFWTHCTSLVKTPVPFLSFCTRNTYKNDFLDRHNGGLWKPHINQDWYQSERRKRQGNIKNFAKFYIFGHSTKSTLCLICLRSFAFLWCKMFQRVGIREGGGPLPLAFQYLIFMV